MSDAEGIVVGANKDGRAEVLLEASELCIHCAEDIEVCNCSADSSRVMVKALNSVGASIGDLVALSHKPGAMFKSISIFLVIPAVGLISGLVAAALLSQRQVAELNTIALCAAAGLFVGIAISVFSYRRVSSDIQPIISRVIQSGLNVPSSLRVMDPVCKRAVDPAMAAGRMSYKGTTYYFCKSGCMENFMKDPAIYVDRDLSTAGP